MLKIIKLSLLYDFYGQLLTEKQQEMFELYYNDDLSLGEIAENQEITRQAVYDNLKRAEKSLNYYEQRLKLVDKFYRQQEKIIEQKEKLMEYKHKLKANKDIQLMEILDYIQNIINELSID